MNERATRLFNQLQDFSNLGIIKGFSITTCTNATGTTITCHLPDETQALALQGILRCRKDDFDCQYRNTKRDGGEQYEVVILINDI